MNDRLERTADKSGTQSTFTVDGFLARAKAKPVTIAHYRAELERMESWLGKPLGAATEDDIVRLKAGRLGKMKSGYHDADLLKMFYRKAGRPDLLPLLGMPHAQPRIKPSDLLTRAEIQRMIDACASLRDKAYIGALWETGVRANELLHVTLNDIRVQESPTNGGKKVYVLWFGQMKETGTEHNGYVIECAVLLEKWLAAYPYAKREDAALFPGWGGKPLSRDGGLHIVKQAAKHAGIKKRVWQHAFRHARPTALLASGKLNETQIASLLGWVPGTNMLRKYAHLKSRDALKGLLEVNGMEPEPVPVERLEFEDERLKAAIPMLMPPAAGSRPPSEFLGIFDDELKARIAKEIEEFVGEHLGALLMRSGFLKKALEDPALDDRVRRLVANMPQSTGRRPRRKGDGPRLSVQERK